MSEKISKFGHLCGIPYKLTKKQNFTIAQNRFSYLRLVLTTVSGNLEEYPYLHAENTRCGFKLGEKNMLTGRRLLWDAMHLDSLTTGKARFYPTVLLPDSGPHRVCWVVRRHGGHAELEYSLGACINCNPWWCRVGPDKVSQLFLWVTVIPD